MIRHILSNLPYVMFGNLAERGAYFAFVNLVNLHVAHDIASTYIRMFALLASLGSVVHFCSAPLIVKTEIDGETERGRRYLGIAFMLLVVTAVAFSSLVSNLVTADAQFRSLLGIPEAYYVVLLSSLGFYDLGKTISLGRGRYPSAVKAQVLYALFILLACALVTLAEIAWLPVSLALLCMPGAVAAYRTYRSAFSGALPAPRAQDVIEFGKFGLPLVVSVLSINPALQLFINTVNGLDPSERLALTIALSWNGMVLSLPGMVSTTSLSQFLQNTAEAKEIKLLRLLYVAACVSGSIIVFGVSILAPWLFEIGGRSMASVIQIIILSSIPMALTLIESNILLSRGHTKHIMYGNFAFLFIMSLAWLYSSNIPNGVYHTAILILLACVGRLAIISIYSFGK